jgi:hypothetical protein
MLFKVIAFNANDIWRQCCELSKQLQDVHIDATLLSETHLKHYEKYFIANNHFYRTGRFLGRRGGNAFAARKGIPHNHVDLPPFLSIEATGGCILICNSEVLLTAVCKLPSHA